MRTTVMCSGMFWLGIILGMFLIHLLGCGDLVLNKSERPPEVVVVQPPPGPLRGAEGETPAAWTAAVREMVQVPVTAQIASVSSQISGQGFQVWGLEEIAPGDPVDVFVAPRATPEPTWEPLVPYR